MLVFDRGVVTFLLPRTHGFGSIMQKIFLFCRKLDICCWAFACCNEICSLFLCAVTLIFYQTVL